MEFGERMDRTVRRMLQASPAFRNLVRRVGTESPYEVVIKPMYALVGAASVASGLYLGMTGQTRMRIPDTTEVAAGSVVPSRLEIACREGSDPCETVVTYKTPGGETLRFKLGYDPTKKEISVPRYE